MVVVISKTEQYKWISFSSKVEFMRILDQNTLSVYFLNKSFVFGQNVKFFHRFHWKCLQNYSYPTIGTTLEEKLIHLYCSVENVTTTILKLVKNCTYLGGCFSGFHKWLTWIPKFCVICSPFLGKKYLPRLTWLLTLWSPRQ